MAPPHVRIPHATLARLPEVGATAFAVLLILYKHADAKGECWPSVAAIAAQIGITRRAAHTALARLRAAGLVAIEKRTRPDGFRQSNLYRLPSRCEEIDPPGCAESALPGVQESTRPGVKESTHRTNTKEELTPRELITPLPPSPPSTEKAPSKSKPADAPMPATLDTPEFRAAWSDWLQHRRELRKPATPTSQAKALKKLADLGAARAVAAVEHSIAQSWVGIFEREDRHANTRRPTLPCGPGQRYDAAAAGSASGRF